MKGVDRDCSFLRAQAASLAEGLRRSGRPECLASALSAHDDGHEPWVRLLAKVAAEDERRLALELSDLYEFHGRLVESLERGLDGWFNGEAAHEIRTVLANRLTDCTEHAVAALERSASLDVNGAERTLTL
jgi:hypothetical protein